MTNAIISILSHLNKGVAALVIRPHLPVVLRVFVDVHLNEQCIAGQPEAQRVEEQRHPSTTAAPAHAEHHGCLLVAR